MQSSAAATGQSRSAARCQARGSWLHCNRGSAAFGTAVWGRSEVIAAGQTESRATVAIANSLDDPQGWPDRKNRSDEPVRHAESSADQIRQIIAPKSKANPTPPRWNAIAAVHFNR